MVYAIQTTPEMREWDTTAAAGVEPAEQIRYGVWEPGDMLEREPDAYRADARVGVYVPQKPAQPNFPYSSSTPNRLIQVYSPENAGGGGVLVEVSAEERPLFQTALIVFEGLHPQARVDVKCVKGIEFRTRPDQLASAYATTSALLDRTAMDNVTKVSQLMPSAHPAADNDFGTIMRWIGKALGFVAPVLSFIPGVGAIASAAAGVGSAALQTAFAERRKQADIPLD
jgi:hypothetical protein